MRCLLIGSTKLGLRSLDTVCSTPGFNVVGCLTAPEVISFRGSRPAMRNLLHANFDDFCKSRSIPCRKTSSGMREEGVADWMDTLKPEMALVVGWHHLIPDEFLDICPFYGVHASLLPDLAGGAPLVWAIVLGRRKTGVSLFRLDPGIDSGPLVDQEAFPISPSERIAGLLEKANEATLAILARSLPEIQGGTARFTRQDLSQQVVVPQRGPEDAQIQWHLGVEAVDRLVRAQGPPYPGAFAYFQGELLRIFQINTNPCPEFSVPEAPEVGLYRWDGDHRLYGKCPDGIVEIVEWT